MKTTRFVRLRTHLRDIYFLYTTITPTQIEEIVQLEKFYKIFKVLDLVSNIYFQARETTKTH